MTKDRGRGKMVFMKDWFEQIEKSCTEVQKGELCYKLIKYGLLEVYEESEDSLVNLLLEMYSPQVDAMQEAYEMRVAAAQKGGRPSSINNEEIWRLAKQGLNGTEISIKLGIPKSTIYSSAGWKGRKDDSYENYEK